MAEFFYGANHWLRIYKSLPPQYKNLTYSNSNRKNGSGVRVFQANKVQERSSFVGIGEEENFIRLNA